MDFAIDFYFGNNNSNDIVMPPGFIYDDYRFFSKMYVFLKLVGLTTYTTTLISCHRSDLYIVMIVFMYIAAMNSLRYEYEHSRRYGTIFSSVEEFQEWKIKLWPKSRITFSMIELVIKIVFFIKYFPPEFKFNNLCEVCDSIFKIHILVLLSIYVVSGILCACLLSTTYCYTSSRPAVVIQNINVSSAVHITIPIPILLTDNNNDECCICLDTSSSESWSMLPCGHKFHSSCVSSWLLCQQRCPVCRHAMISVS
jgi:hypothetical protein